jgi:uncharacterized membrane protein
MRSAILISGLALAGCAAVQGSAPAEASFALPERFIALGTEPFWAAKVDGARLTYSTPLDEKGRIVAITRSLGADHATVEGALDGRALRLTVTAGPCSDGMSDTVYPFTIARTVGDAVERGCARVE